MHSERFTTELQPLKASKLKKNKMADTIFYFSAILQRNAGHRYIIVFYIMHFIVNGRVVARSKALV